MDDLFNLAIYLIVGLVWLISVLGGKKKGRRFPEEMEFPFPLPFPPEPESGKSPSASPRGEKEESLSIPKQEELPSEAQIELPPAPAIKPQIVTAEEAERAVYYKEIELPGFDVSEESLEDGIILSALLGPPKGFKYFQRL